MPRTNIQINVKFRQVVHHELNKRMATNPKYSLRALAKSLNINSSTLSQILHGKRLISEEKIEALCKKLGVSFQQISDDGKYHAVGQDQFALISDWYHYAIFDLTHTKDFQSDPKWIAEKLGISPETASAAIERLLRLGMLTKRYGRLQKATPLITNATTVDTTTALKEYQRQVVKKALAAIDECPQERKDITSISIATNTKRLKEAQKMIKKFRRDLCDFLETGEKDAVYLLTLQLFPVTPN